MPDTLQRFTVPLGADDRAHLLEDPTWLPPTAVTVLRADGAPVRLDALDNLFREFADRRERGEWDDDRSMCDRWLAPRVHWALRLTRAQAADRTTWTWLALRHMDHTRWRWDGDKGITEDRWSGAINKQAVARLWWGAEIFRNGGDYEPVQRAFVFQDFVNSLLHGTAVRHRPLALGLVDYAVPKEAVVRGSEDVRAVANAVNLATSGAPPEAETSPAPEDVLGYLAWTSADAPVPTDWADLPHGPTCAPTDEAALERARAIVSRCADWSVAAMLAKGGRGAQRLERRQERAVSVSEVGLGPS